MGSIMGSVGTAPRLARTGSDRTRRINQLSASAIRPSTAGSALARRQHRSMAGTSFLLTVGLLLLLSTGSALVLAQEPDVQRTGNDYYVAAVEEIVAKCVSRCPEQNQTSFSEHIDASCGNDCYIKQCTIGCQHWRLALETSCQHACNITNHDFLEAREWSCIMGCNDGLNQYFRWLKAEIGTPQAPALVADSLTATALSLEWEVPERLLDVSLHWNHGPRSYLVQWRYEEVAGDWKYCRNQSMGENSTVRVDNLQPYTKYRFRVALLLSPKHDQVLTSEQSVIISTLPSGVPTSQPTIVRAVAVDHSRISVSWEPGPFPNGPVLSYVLQIKELHPIGYSAIKDITESSTTRYYIFGNLDAERNYSVSVAERNPEGEGPASVTHVTTPAKPTCLEENFLPTLILGAERSILTQSYNMFTDAPTSFYSSPAHKIRGTAMHIRRGLIFISDEAGYVYRAPSRQDAQHDRLAILTPGAANNFRPTLLSVDWLNDHLYILGQVRNTQLWQISHCDFDGNHLTVAIAGLQRRPHHFEVDPYNGYLFWVVGGARTDAGLFRLDLGDISNGVKHEIKPLQVARGSNFGAFAIDHTNFRVLIADQGLNTVLSVSLDGKQVENIRNNTQQPRFEKVKSLALANGLFYWTNGTEVFAEDYHKVHNSYYHNAFPIASNNTYFSISVNLTSEQPIPIPVNPPRNVQALVSPNRLKISWDVPYLLGIMGRGAWQSWRYRLEVTDERLATVIHTAEANGTSYACAIEHRLLPNQLYVVRATAFTEAGLGPWSREFRVRTLRDKQQRQLVWASAEGILRSDVIGENVSTLIGRSAELDGASVTNLAWYNDTLYVVSNSTLRLYRAPTGGGASWVKFRELESVECVTIDPIGRRLYFSNPAQQMIVRASLHGEQHEPIHSVMNVRELRFDARRGYIYYSSGLILEAFQLNGKNRLLYFSASLFTGKQIVGMTLDLDGHKVYWIVRSYSHSHLYWAPLAGTGAHEPKHMSTDSAQDASLVGTTLPPYAAGAGGPVSPAGQLVPQMKILTDETPQGPLLHFSDRLLWLKESQVVIGDAQGENLAYIRSHQLNGTRALALIDAEQEDLGGELATSWLAGRTPFNVLPATVDSGSIRVTGSSRRFTISWAPVANVNYTSVFYKLILKLPDARDIVQELTVPYFVYGDSADHELIPPYTPIDITLHAFTYWRSSGFATTQRHTPAGKPSVPVHPHAYIHHSYLAGSYELQANVVFRWSPPLEPNGPIVAYLVDCWVRQQGNSSASVVLFEDLRVPAPGVGGRLELPLTIQAHPNTTYFLQVRVRNVDHESDSSSPASSVSLQAPGHTLPLLYVATPDQILLLDLDRRESTPLVSTAVPATLLTELRHERKLLWVNANGELLLHDNIDGKRKLAQIPASQGKATALAVDWLARTVYVRVQATGMPDEDDANTGGTSLLYIFDLNRLVVESGSSPESGMLHQPIQLPADPAQIDILQVLPEQRKLLAMSRETGTGFSGLLSATFQLLNVVHFNCTTDDDAPPVCEEYRQLFNSPHRQGVTQDAGFLYWIANGTVQLQPRQYPDAFADGGDVSSKPDPRWNRSLVEDAVALLPVQLQPFPSVHCLVPLVHNVDYRPTLLEATESSLTLHLPSPKAHGNCSMRPPGIRYRIQYRALASALEPAGKLFVTESYVQNATIRNLRPFTQYEFGVQLLSYYTEQLQQVAAPRGERRPSSEPAAPLVTFSTAAGAPSKPEILPALPISPSEAVVSWHPPKQKNNDRVWYEIYWQTETGGHKNRQLQQVTELSDVDNMLSMNLTRLQPNQTYSIGIRAYTTNTTFSESEPVEIRTFPEPSDIELVSINSTGMRLHWVPPANARRYKLQYAISGTDNWQLLHDSQVVVVPSRPPVPYTYELGELLPKTLYRFSILIYYPDRDLPYLWPREMKQFSFETLADKPSTPGRPLVTQLRQDVYKVSWEPAKDNGATIEEYSLEALVRHASKRPVRSVNLAGTAGQEQEQGVPPTAVDDEDGDEGDGRIGEGNATTASEFDFDEHWSQVYNGTDIYWIIPERHAIHNNLFRVRARNCFGWGPYSDESRPVGEELDGSRFQYLALVTGLIIAVLVVVCIVPIFYIVHRSKRKTLASEPIGANRQSDGELVNLRELPRRGNFVHSTNILYSSGVVPDTEMARLPQINREQISIEVGPLLGSGAFGEVNEGLVKGVGGQVETRVAIKTLKKGAKEHEKQEFLQEAKLMSNFKHKHITRLIGVCIEGDELMIVMELMQGGDLLSYLRRSRAGPGRAARLTMLDLISMCQDVASGCRYLEEMHFVHRDLACRNCLVSSVDPRERVVKIGDFGLARDIYKNDYYRKEGEGLLPVRWMAPESLIDGVFTSQSDIWAFGVLLWEIITLGEQPYPAKNNVEVLHHVREGGHLDRPKVCPTEMYELMKYCWRFSPDKRPTFRYCLEMLNKLHANTSADTQIIAPFPAKLQQEAVSNPTYLATEPCQISWSSACEMPTMQQRAESAADFLSTPPTSSSGSGGAPANTGQQVPKYLELLYDDSNGIQHSPPIAPQLQQQCPMVPTDNGYEIPITDRRCQQLALVGLGNEACSSLDPLLPAAVRLPFPYPGAQERYDDRPLTMDLPPGPVANAMRTTIEDGPATAEEADSPGNNRSSIRHRDEQQTLSWGERSDEVPRCTQTRKLGQEVESIPGDIKHDC